MTESESVALPFGDSPLTNNIWYYTVFFFVWQELILFFYSAGGLFAWILQAALTGRLIVLHKPVQYFHLLRRPDRNAQVIIDPRLVKVTHINIRFPQRLE